MTPRYTQALTLAATAHELWYYTQLAEIFTTRQVAPAVAISRTCAQVAAILAGGDASCRGNT